MRRARRSRGRTASVPSVASSATRSSTEGGKLPLMAVILAEGTGRNTAASIALAALWIRGRLGDAVMLVLPSDHWIARPRVFRSALRRGAQVVRRGGGLLTLGVRPEAPETGFGYIGPCG